MLYTGNIVVGQTEQESRGIRIVRIWHTMTHNHRQIAKIDSAYTIRCMEGHRARGLFLALGESLPNLRVFDSAGTEYPVMDKEDVNKRLEHERTNPRMNKLAKKVYEGAFPLWIRFPPDKVMKPGEVE